MATVIQRDKYWDTLKVVLILIVVYGHIIIRYSPADSINCAITNWIYLFHMPLFVFISGRFSHVRDKKKYATGLLRIFETYAIFQFIRVAWVVHGGHDMSVAHMITSPMTALWYLMCLIWWRLIVFSIGENRMNRYAPLVILLSVFVCFTGRFIPTTAFSLQRFCSFLPFFILGYYSIRIDFKDYLKKIPFWAAALFLVAVFVVIYKYFNTGGNFLWCSEPYSNYTDMLKHTGLFVAQVVMCVMFMRMFFFNDKFLYKWGSTTLFVYIIHIFITNEKLPQLIKHFGLPTDFISLFLYALLLTAVLIFMARLPFFSFWMNPISNTSKYLAKRKSDQQTKQG